MEINTMTMPILQMSKQYAYSHKAGKGQSQAICSGNWTTLSADLTAFCSSKAILLDPKRSRALAGVSKPFPEDCYQESPASPGESDITADFPFHRTLRPQ